MPAYDHMNSGANGPGGGQPQQGYNPRNNRIAKVIIIALAAILLIPLLGGFGGVLVGILIAMACLFFVPIILGITFFASGAFVIVCGASIIPAFLGSGLLTIGVGIALLGLGLLCLYAGGRLLGKVLPTLVRGTVNTISGLYHKLMPTNRA